MPQNLVNIDLPNLVGWLEETLTKEQKLFSGHPFQLEDQIQEKKRALQDTLWKEQKLFRGYSF